MPPVAVPPCAPPSPLTPEGPRTTRKARTGRGTAPARGEEEVTVSAPLIATAASDDEPDDGRGGAAAPEPSVARDAKAKPAEDDLFAWLQRMQAGDAAAREHVFRRVYDELRATAAAIMGSRARGTFQPSDLVSGAYLRLLATDKPWESRKHFMDVAADAMLHVLIDHVRRRKAKKRGGGRTRVADESLEGVVRSMEERGIVMLDLYDALRELEEEQPEWARMAKLRLFAGLELSRVFEVMGLSQRTGEREWRAARTMLGARLRGWDPDAGDDDRALVRA